jgi:hypothetical protein
VITIDRVLRAKRESKHIEFKQCFDITAAADWCEVIKDIAAIANSGGGAIVFGADSKGLPVGVNVSAIAGLDSAHLTDKLHSYTGCHFAAFELAEVKKGKRSVAILRLGAASVPLIFTKPGTYAIDEKKQKTAFGVGTLYFRHGAKSEPATTQDLADVLERRLAEVRKQWIGGVRKVIEAPPGSSISVLPREVRASDEPGAVPIRFVQDDTAQAFRLVDIDKIYPYRQKELVTEVRKRLPKGSIFNSFDVQVLRKLNPVLETDVFSHKPNFGSRQYNDGTVSWIIAAYKKDPNFFAKARAAFRQ